MGKEERPLCINCHTDEKRTIFTQRDNDGDIEDEWSLCLPCMKELIIFTICQRAKEKEKYETNKFETTRTTPSP